VSASFKLPAEVVQTVELRAMLVVVPAPVIDSLSEALRPEAERRKSDRWKMMMSYLWRGASHALPNDRFS